MLRKVCLKSRVNVSDDNSMYLNLSINIKHTTVINQKHLMENTGHTNFHCWRSGCLFGPSQTCTWHAAFMIWIIRDYVCRLSDVLWRLVNTNWVISLSWLSAGRQSVHLYPVRCLMVAVSSWTCPCKHNITAKCTFPSFKAETS